MGAPHLIFVMMKNSLNIIVPYYDFVNMSYYAFNLISFTGNMETIKKGDTDKINFIHSGGYIYIYFNSCLQSTNVQTCKLVTKKYTKCYRSLKKY